MANARVTYDKFNELYDRGYFNASPERIAEYLRLCYLALLEDGHGVHMSADDAYARVIDTSGKEGKRTVRFWGININDPATAAAYRQFENAHYKGATPVDMKQGNTSALPRIPQNVIDKLSAAPVVTPPVVTPPVVTPPVVTKRHAKYLLGVSCLNDHRIGWEALKAGCRSVLFMDGLMEAINAAKAYPDAIIFARFWFQHAPDPKFLADHMGAGLMDVPSNMRTTVANEGDWLDYGTAEQVVTRFNYERAVCESVWARNPNRVMVIGEFSHGTPDTTKPEIIKAWVDTYGAFAKANPNRIRLGWHLYTFGRRFSNHPGKNQLVVDPVWFEGRDEVFYKALGSPANVKHTCGETGVESGDGGFYAYNDQQFIEWCDWWLGYRRGLTVDMEGACIFQIGSHPNWQGYNVARFMGILSQYWSGQRGANIVGQRFGLGLLSAPVYDAPPTDYTPARKMMK